MIRCESWGTGIRNVQPNFAIKVDASLSLACSRLFICPRMPRTILSLPLAPLRDFSTDNLEPSTNAGGFLSGIGLRSRDGKTACA